MKRLSFSQSLQTDFFPTYTSPFRCLKNRVGRGRLDELGYEMSAIRSDDL
ncbi:hypothetical protein GCM10010911_52750 [Paenibacillus nasutitermitis]|uniref:Uncharacterized protein n=1 Tax=Paenibacillus nasutitermitis TaxID=1652958 RepID=A0A916ZDB6_9BACL|nr:hypothetical protein GCM10010911_52750 [Paenibacillus nasutitermitis]